MPHVVIAGNIATGKSTLTHALSDALGVPSYVERWEDNPFLPHVAESPDRWAFLSQMSFLLASVASHAAAARSPGGVQERGVTENVEIFAEDLADRGALEPSEVALLRDVLKRASAGLSAPDVTIFLHAPAEVLLDRIQSRGRGFESGLTVDDLGRLGDRYARFAQAAPDPVVAVDTAEHDIRDPQVLESIVTKVNEAAWQRS